MLENLRDTMSGHSEQVKLTCIINAKCNHDKCTKSQLTILKWKDPKYSYTGQIYNVYSLIAEDGSLNFNS